MRNPLFAPIKPVKPEALIRDPQLKELEAADLPADKKKLIITEYRRLCKLHPNWKVYKAMRKAGEKYSVKIYFE